MSVTLTFGDLRLLIQQRLDDRGADTFQWGLDEVVEGLNYALEHVTRELGLTRVEMGPITPGANAIVDLPNLITILYVRDYTTMKLFLKSTPEQEDRLDPNWRAKTGVPFAWMDHDGSRIRLNRIPTVATYVSVGYIETPIQFTYTGVPATDDAQTVDGRIPLFVQDKLKLAAAAYLLRQAGDHKDLVKAEQLMAQFMKEIGADAGAAARTVVER